MYYVGTIPVIESDIKHFGTKGMKWGVRKYQNEDGTFNEAGKQRYFQTSDGKIKKRGLIDRSFRTGQAKMTKKDGSERGLVSGVVRTWGKHALKGLGEQSAVSILGSAATVGVAALTRSGAAATAVSAGTAAVAGILGIRRSISYVSEQVGVASTWAKRRGEKREAKGG